MLSQVPCQAAPFPKPEICWIKAGACELAATIHSQCHSACKEITHTKI